MNSSLREILYILLSIMCLIQSFTIYSLKQEVRTSNMLISFDWDIINDREKLLDKHGIEYSDYIYVEEKDK